MTDQEATIGSSDKVAMKKYELDQIMGIVFLLGSLERIV
jgi:hypothetical protein